MDITNTQRACIFATGAAMVTIGIGYSPLGRYLARHITSNLPPPFSSWSHSKFVGHAVVLKAGGVTGLIAFACLKQDAIKFSSLNRPITLRSSAEYAPIQKIKPELWERIFIHLDPETRKEAKQVCALWRGVLRSIKYTRIVGEQSLPQVLKITIVDKPHFTRIHGLPTSEVAHNIYKEACKHLVEWSLQKINRSREIRSKHICHLKQLVALQVKLGQMEEARLLFVETAQIIHTLRDNEKKVIFLGKLAVQQAKAGQAEEARLLLEQAHELIDSSSIGDTRKILLRMSLASVQTNIEQWEEEDLLWEKYERTILDKIMCAENRVYLLKRLAEVYLHAYHQARQHEAVRLKKICALLEQIENILDSKIADSKNKYKFRCLAWLAHAYKQIGRNERAEVLYQKAEAIACDMDDDLKFSPLWQHRYIILLMRNLYHRERDNLLLKSISNPSFDHQEASRVELVTMGILSDLAYSLSYIGNYKEIGIIISEMEKLIPTDINEAKERCTDSLAMLYNCRDYYKNCTLRSRTILTPGEMEEIKNKVTPWAPNIDRFK